MLLQGDGIAGEVTVLTVSRERKRAATPQGEGPNASRLRTIMISPPHKPWHKRINACSVAGALNRLT
jgi:hypothetical protein